jgi:hypothetical protein
MCNMAIKKRLIKSFCVRLILLHFNRTKLQTNKRQQTNLLVDAITTTCAEDVDEGLLASIKANS